MINPAELAHHLHAPLKPLYTIYGEETLLVLEAADQLRTAARMQGYSEREVLTVESGFQWAQLIYANQSLSLFSNKKMIELRIPTGKPGSEGSNALISYAECLSSDTLTLILLPKLDKATLNSKWFKALASKGECIAAQPIQRTHLPAWIQGRLKAQQQSLQADALAFLCDRVEGNLLAAHQEIQKLALLFPPGEISLSTLQDAIVNAAKYDIFKLTEALLQGDPVRFTRMLRGLLAEGEAPNLILWVITDEIRTLLKVGQGRARGASMAELCRTHRIWGDKAKWIEPMLAQLTSQQLKRALLEAARIDAMIKGLLPGQVEDALEALGLSLIHQTAPCFQIRTM
jgi:DNA polymerase-3 subunit delta